MKLLAVILVAGLVVCGYLILRHHHRVAAPAPATPASAEQRDLRAATTFQRGIQLDARTDYAALSPAARDKLRREEERQKPQEGRN